MTYIGHIDSDALRAEVRARGRHRGAGPTHCSSCGAKRNTFTFSSDQVVIILLSAEVLSACSISASRRMLGDPGPSSPSAPAQDSLWAARRRRLRGARTTVGACPFYLAHTRAPQTLPQTLRRAYSRGINPYPCLMSSPSPCWKSCDNRGNSPYGNAYLDPKLSARTF